MREKLATLICVSIEIPMRETNFQIDQQFELRIDETNCNQRIDRVLSSHPLISSRTRAATLIEKKLVLLNGKPIKASQKTSVGERFIVCIPKIENEESLEPYNIDLEIQYEDKDLLVVNKPAGLVVHPAHGHYKETLVNALLHHTHDLSMGFSENRPGIVHRIDKETSGLLVVAKNNFAHEFLAQQFQERTIHRKYWAIVYGHIREDQGRIESFIARHPQDRKKFSSRVSAGKIAITNFKKIQESPRGFSLLELKLETGRTHQIRVHLADKGFPIVADNLYGALRRTKLVESLSLQKIILSLSRIALHAKELGFIHPQTREKLFFSSAIPKDLRLLMDELGFHE